MNFNFNFNKINLNKFDQNLAQSTKRKRALSGQDLKIQFTEIVLIFYLISLG